MVQWGSAQALVGLCWGVIASARFAIDGESLRDTANRVFAADRYRCPWLLALRVFYLLMVTAGHLNILIDRGCWPRFFSVQTAQGFSRKAAFQKIRVGGLKKSNKGNKPRNNRKSAYDFRYIRTFYFVINK